MMHSQSLSLRSVSEFVHLRASKMCSGRLWVWRSFLCGEGCVWRQSLQAMKSRYSKAKRQADRTRVNNGIAFPQWHQRKFTKGIKSDTELACFLLNL